MVMSRSMHPCDQEGLSGDETPEPADPVGCGRLCSDSTMGSYSPKPTPWSPPGLFAALGSTPGKPCAGFALWL